MANIHTFGTERPNRPSPGTGSRSDLDWLYPSSQSSDPRSETFFSMLHSNLCPALTFFSFAAIMCLVVTGAFVAQLSIDGINGPGSLLEAKYGPMTSAFTVVKGRNFVQHAMAWLVHRDLPMLVSSLLLLVIWVSSVQFLLGFLRCLAVFMLGSFSGYLFGAMFIDESARLNGALPGVFALLGAAIGFIILNWKLMENSSGGRAFYFFWMLILMVILSFMLTSSFSTIMCQLGALLAGTGLGMLLADAKSEDPGRHKVVRIIGGCLYALLLAIAIPILLSRK